MADLARTWEAAVIDEVQMLGDPQRGSAWTRAVLGLPARRLALCGNVTALPLVEHLIRETGAELGGLVCMQLPAAGELMHSGQACAITSWTQA